jgi:urease accessory protein
MDKMKNELIRIGIGGPVGAGKTLLIEKLLPKMIADGLNVVVVTNDLVTKEDAARLKDSGLIDPDRIVGVETGACPHTAIREDPAANLCAVERLSSLYDPDIVFVESGGDNLASTFSPDLVDYWIFMIDCAAGHDIPRKRGLGVLKADLVLVNKADIAAFVGTSLEKMAQGMEEVRPDRAWLMSSLLNDEDVQEIYETLLHQLPFKRRADAATT